MKLIVKIGLRAAGGILETKIEVNEDETTIKQVAADLAKQHGIAVQRDQLVSVGNLAVQPHEISFIKVLEDK